MKESVRLHSVDGRKIGDVMPFYHEGEYHVFYIQNGSGHDNINWEHAVSRDLVNWEHKKTAISLEDDGTFLDCGCIFTGSVIRHRDIFHAFYTSWNPENPNGREFIRHAVSTDLENWTKLYDNVLAPDGYYYSSSKYRDFRDPCVTYNEETGEFEMLILANSSKTHNLSYEAYQDFNWITGRFTSLDLMRWTPMEPIGEIPGDECPDYFKIGNTHYIHGCKRYAHSTISRYGPYQYAEQRELDRPYTKAAKICYDGKRYLWFGGFCGGPMTIPRELYAGEDGLLFLKPAQEIVQSFNKVLYEYKDNPFTEKIIDTPSRYLLQLSVVTKGSVRLSFMLQENTELSYNYTIIGENKDIVLTGPNVSAIKKLPLPINEKIKVTAIVEEELIELFVDNRYAFSCSTERLSRGKLMIKLLDSDGKIESLNVMVR